MTPSQVAAPVQLEALPVAVRRADGESVARQEVRSPRAALGQSLRLVQLLTLRTLLCSRSGHGNISRVVPRRWGGGKKTATADAAHVRSKGVVVEGEKKTNNYNITVTGLAEVCMWVVSSTASLEAFRWGGGEGGGRKYGRTSRLLCILFPATEEGDTPPPRPPRFKKIKKKINIYKETKWGDAN